MAVEMSVMVFQVVRPCGLLHGYHILEEHVTIISINTDTALSPMFLSFIGDRSNTFLQNVGNHLQDHPVSTQKTMTDNWQLYRIWPDLANTDYCMF